MQFDSGSAAPEDASIFNKPIGCVGCLQNRWLFNRPLRCLGRFCEVPGPGKERLLKEPVVPISISTAIRMTTRTTTSTNCLETAATKIKTASISLSLSLALFLHLSHSLSRCCSRVPSSCRVCCRHSSTTFTGSATATQ